MAEPDVDAIVADLVSTGVHRGPGTQTWIGDRQLAQITEAAEAGDVPLRLVLLAPPSSGQGDLYQGDDLLVRIHDAGGPDGLYVGVNGVWSETGEPGPPTLPFLQDGSSLHLALQQWGTVGGLGDVTDDLDLVLSYGNGPGEAYPLGEGLLRVVEALGEGTFPALVDSAHEGLDLRLAEDDEGTAEDPADETADETGTGVPAPAGEQSGDEGVGGADVALGVFVALVAVATAVTLLARRARRRAQAARTFELPDSVLDRVRSAGDADLLRRARKDVLALGEAIDAAEMDGADSPAWAAALDHYDAAGRLLPPTDDPVDPLDAAGAVVLADRGRQALAAAERGRAFTPTTTCFLNPLHGRAELDRTLEHKGRRLKAPVCTTCRKDLEAGRRPDILDVVVRGVPQHYFETGREPWASTGFGALDPDLVTRLHRGLR
ncbi:hypothetical protein [Nocardioides campestrisoli]|uniref:hypothetical protein n=1 Tax=Nocardioides campestrisoli TaxID=2736757 RepID=UPI00163D5B85|nr:hypothetical protein [Nocardioides campestrisoli]